MQLVAADRVYARVDTSYGRGQLALVAPRPLRRAVLVGRPLLERVVAPLGVKLPVRKGDELGEVRLYDRGALLARSPLVASRSISSPGGLDRAGWYIGQTVRNMWGWVS